MDKSDAIIDFSEFDLNQVVSDREEIRRYNPQRFEMEQLDAIVLEDNDRGLCVGYKDVREDEFWIHSYMANSPVMPGVLMCEAAAQLASFFVAKYDLLGHRLVGLGGMQNIRITRSVFPHDRLVIAVKKTRVRRGAIIVCRFQGFVDQQLAIEGTIKGVPLPET